MERVAKKVKLEVDLTKPVNLEDFPIDENDCFGGEWDMMQKECQLCADNEICGILFGNRVVKPRIKEFEEKQGQPFLDLMDFSLIDTEQIKDGLDGMTVAAFFEFVKKMAKASDDVAVKEWVKRFLVENGYGIENSVIYKK